MTVRRLSAVLLALCLGALSAFAVACGEEREGLITASRGSDIQDALDRIESDVSQGDCGQVLDDHLASLRREIEDLPGSVDRGLRQRLREGLEELETQAPTDCEGSDTTETEPETTPETVPETIPETVPEVPQETVPPETTPPETTPPPPETPTPAPEEPLPPSGGEEAPQGNGNGNNGNGNGNGALEEDG